MNKSHINDWLVIFFLGILKGDISDNSSHKEKFGTFLFVLCLLIV